MVGRFILYYFVYARSRSTAKERSIRRRREWRVRGSAAAGPVKVAPSAMDRLPEGDPESGIENYAVP